MGNGKEAHDMRIKYELGTTITNEFSRPLTTETVRHREITNQTTDQPTNQPTNHKRTRVCHHTPGPATRRAPACSRARTRESANTPRSIARTRLHRGRGGLRMGHNAEVYISCGNTIALRNSLRIFSCKNKCCETESLKLETRIIVFFVFQ